MKKAEEYFNEFTKDLTGFHKLAYEFHKLSVLDKIRTIQLDAIEYAVNKCSENAKACECSRVVWDDKRKENVFQIGVFIDSQSILNTFDQIKEEMK